MPRAGRPHQSTSPESAASVAGDDADQRALARAVGTQKAVKPWAERQGDTGQGLLFAWMRAGLFAERPTARRGLGVGFFEAVQG